MARVPEAELDRIKSEVSVERLAEARGIALRRHGADLLGLCPFHDDHEPSLVISPEKNLWHCLGACQAGGSVVDWVMRAQGVSFRHAVELLRTDPSFAASAVPVVRKSSVKRLSAPVEQDADDQEALRQVVAYYRTTLAESPEATAYLEARGLCDRDALDHFQIGFANRTLGLRLPDKNRKAGEEMRSRLQRLGILRPSGHEHFNGSVVLPVMDSDGNVVEMYGRKVRDDLRAGTPDHLYLPGSHRGVWNVGGLADADSVILCEALFDALTFWVNGLRNVTAAYGIEGFTQEHLDALTGNNIGRSTSPMTATPRGTRPRCSWRRRWSPPASTPSGCSSRTTSTPTRSRVWNRTPPASGCTLWSVARCGWARDIDLTVPMPLVTRTRSSSPSRRRARIRARGRKPVLLPRRAPQCRSRW